MLVNVEKQKLQLETWQNLKNVLHYVMFGSQLPLACTIWILQHKHLK
jgi:hypothetical protein